MKIGDVSASYIDDVSGETVVTFTRRLDATMKDFRDEFVEQAKKILVDYQRHEEKRTQVEQSLTDLLNNQV